MRTLLPLLFTCLFIFDIAQSDTLTSTPVGPGIIHHHAYLTGGPWHIQILEVDLSDTLNTLETVKADNLVAGYETTSSMAARSTQAGHTVIGAINGDFYATGGVTIGAQVSKGTLLRGPYPRSVFGLTQDKSPLTDIMTFSGLLTKDDTSSIAISGVNQVRNENMLIIYNHYMGNRTGTNIWGAEVTVQYLEAPEMVNLPLRAVVVSKDSIHAAGHGNSPIPLTGGAVLSGHGLARDFINESIFVGDTITIELNLAPGSEPIKEMVGGTPRLIRNGVRSVEYEEESVGYSFTHDRHPRTAVGFTQDSSKVFLMTVDGRQPGFSVGMSLFELADYMLDWGIYQAVNLDGGGSTTMVVRGDIANSPSDAGGERSVANALMVISKAPVQSLAFINLPWEETFTPVESSLQFAVTGTDSFYNPVAVPQENLAWDCDDQIGSISTTGLFTASEAIGSGYIWVNLDEIVDSVFINVTDIATLTLQPNPIVLEVNETQQMIAIARDNLNHILNLDADSYEWSITPELGTISVSGLVAAENQGEGLIQASFRSISASVPLTVGSANSVTIDDFSSVSNYSLSGAVINLASCSLVSDAIQFVSPPTSGRLDYSLTTGGVSVLYLDCNIPVSGTPESVSIQVYGDNSAHWIRGEFKNASNEKFLVNFTAAAPGINWNDEWRELEVALEDAEPHWGNSTAVLSFPITWTKIYLAETDDNNKDSGTIYIDDLKATFVTSSIERPNQSTPIAFQLEDNYPNPFNSSTNFRFNIKETGLLTLHLYSLDGRKIDSLSHAAVPGNHTMTWNADKLPSGIYFFRASMAQHVIAGKCLLVK